MIKYSKLKSYYDIGPGTNFTIMDKFFHSSMCKIYDFFMSA